MDIAAALEATAPLDTDDRCKLARWLDDIPDADPRKSDLVLAIETRRPQKGEPASPHYRTYDDLSLVLALLGFRTSKSTLMKHRRQRCRCHGYSA